MDIENYYETEPNVDLENQRVERFASIIESFGNSIESSPFTNVVALPVSVPLNPSHCKKDPSHIPRTGVS